MARRRAILPPNSVQVVNLPQMSATVAIRSDISINRRGDVERCGMTSKR
jgi:hypothetical protein